ncbi:MAG: hypothetical protein Q9182_005386 [Xanthomendoza sp. 2 TL-2023]
MYRSGILALLGWAVTAIAQGNLGLGDTSACAPSYSTQQYIGCYSDAQNGNHLNFPFKLSTVVTDRNGYPGYSNQNNLTVDVCLGACRAHGWKYASVYNQYECWCGNQLPYPTAPNGATVDVGSGIGTYSGTSPGTPALGSNCNRPCPANPSQICGGPGYGSVYLDQSFQNDTSPASIGVAANYRGGPGTCGGTAGGYSVYKNIRLQGCYIPRQPGTAAGLTYVAPSNAGGACTDPVCYGAAGAPASSTVTSSAVSSTVSSLTSTSPTSSSISTISSSTSAQTPTSISSTSTSTTASVTPTVVQSAPPYTHQGCYTEATRGRALAAASVVSGDMTVQKCAAFCNTNGYIYMGVEYSTECYCANTIERSRHVRVFVLSNINQYIYIFILLYVAPDFIYLFILLNVLVLINFAILVNRVNLVDLFLNIIHVNAISLATSPRWSMRPRRVWLCNL